MNITISKKNQQQKGPKKLKLTRQKKVVERTSIRVTPRKPVSKQKTSVSAFQKALYDPFSPKSIGCQVPDPFCFPTVTYHLHQTTVLKGPTSNAGTGSVMFLPNPNFSMLDVSTAATLSTANSIVGSTPMVTYTGATQAYRAIGISELFNKFGTYRVVSWGIKISNLQPELSATGRIIVAHVPIGNDIPSANVMNSVAVTNADYFTPVVGITPANLNSSSVIELPDAVEFAVQDLLHGDVEISGRYTNSTFWEFKSASLNDTAAAGIREGDDIVITDAGATVIAGLKDTTKCVGGTAIVVYIEGMPSTTANFLQVETIYHLEGTPSLGGSTNSALVPASAIKAHIGTTEEVEEAMVKASYPDMAYKFLTKGAQFLNDNRRLIDSVASKFL